MAAATYQDLARLLSAGLDLCVRARRLDAQDRTNVMMETFHSIDMERAAAGLNASRPEAPYTTRSLTMPLWVEQQYETDLAAWEVEARAALSRLSPYDFALTVAAAERSGEACADGLAQDEPPSTPEGA